MRKFNSKPEAYDAMGLFLKIRNFKTLVANPLNGVNNLGLMFTSTTPEGDKVTTFINNSSPKEYVVSYEFSRADREGVEKGFL